MASYADTLKKILELNPNGQTAQIVDKSPYVKPGITMDTATSTQKYVPYKDDSQLAALPNRVTGAALDDYIKSQQPQTATQTAQPLQAASTPTAQQTVQPVQAAAPVQSGPSAQDYINMLKQAQLQQRYADLQNAYNKNISSLNAEKSTIQPMYYDKRNQTSTASQQSARNFAEYMASRGQTGAGASAQGELNRVMSLQGNIGSLNRQEAQNIADIERRRSDLATALEQDRISQASGIEANAMQNLINQFNTDRNYNYQLSRDSVGDKQTDFSNSLALAGLTGNYNGIRTLAGQQSDASIAGQLLQNEAQAIQNRFLPQIQQGQIDAQTLSNAYQGMVNSNYSKEEAAKIAQILAQTQGVKLSNDAQALANKYYPQIQQGQIDGQKLQNSYQKLVNAGYPAQQAAEIAAKNANIAQGWSQIAISRQNANTSAAVQAWSQNKDNPDNVYKQLQIDKTKNGVSGSAATMTTKQIGDAKIKIAQQLYNQTGSVPTQSDIDSAFASLYGTTTKAVTASNTNVQELYSAADSIPAANRQKWYNDNKAEIDKYAGFSLKEFKAKYGIK